VVFRSFPQENEKNHRATLMSVKLISVALKTAGPRAEAGIVRL
jgi:hypothetical protein